MVVQEQSEAFIVRRSGEFQDEHNREDEEMEFQDGHFSAIVDREHVFDECLSDLWVSCVSDKPSELDPHCKRCKVHRRTIIRHTTKSQYPGIWGT